MKAQIINSNIKAIAEANEKMSQGKNVVVFLEAVFFEYRGEEEFIVKVIYDNYPNTEHCFSSDCIYKTKEYFNFTQDHIDLLVEKAMEINEREWKKRIA
ncbi:hypothetical protein [Aquitalea pelogenes]|uniref:hypothetical protein n=1 Tax=Aquitalea pelogenes TaxID=1293573 RepID=UPI0035B0E7B2